MLQSTYGDLGAGVVSYGHIHRSFVRSVGGVTVANAGSAGMPWDGDPRAAYLSITDEGVEIVRVEYDIEPEVETLLASEYLEAARIAAMLREGRFVTPTNARRTAGPVAVRRLPSPLCGATRRDTQGGQVPAGRPPGCDACRARQTTVQAASPSIRRNADGACSVSSRSTRQRWLWSPKPRSAASQARSRSPPARRSSAARVRRRIRWREIV